MGDNYYLMQRAADWVRRAFGERMLTDRRERAMRFVEEALELGQACGLTEEELARLQRRVWSRPPGSPAQEAAGSYFTLLVLANARGIDLEHELLKEFKRVDTPEMIAHIRQKHAAKVVAGTGIPLDAPA